MDSSRAIRSGSLPKMKNVGGVWFLFGDVSESREAYRVCLVFSTVGDFVVVYIRLYYRRVQPSMFPLS
jgi:hypothetical protein